MRSSLPILFCMLALTAYGCSANAPDPYSQAAQEVESAAAALDQADSDDMALDEADKGDADTDADETADEAAGGGHHRGGDSDRVSDETGDASVGHGRREHGGKHGGGGHKHGRGHDLLLAYADLDALQVCQDLRAGCATSADKAACRDQVHACVKPILADAFEAMCAERVAMCAADDADEHSCKRVNKHCGGDSTDAGTP